MPYLTWIADKDLISAVEKLLKAAQSAAKNAPSKLHKNVIDPFSAMFQMAGFDLTTNELIKSEITRQGQKSYQNHVGTFHQNILGSVVDWSDLGVGNVMDLISTKHKIIAEVKNKHNTVTGSKLVDVYNLLEAQVMPKASIYHGYTAYFVNIIPKRPKRSDEPFTPSDNKTSTVKAINPKIRIIDGYSFYDLVTNKQDSLKELFNILPTVINSLVAQTKIDGNDEIFLKDFFDKAYK